MALKESGGESSIIDLLNKHLRKKNIKIGPNYLEYEKVRFFPRALTFSSVHEGGVQRKMFRILNAGTKGVTVQVKQPKSLIFKISNEKRTVLAPGISLRCLVDYHISSKEIMDTTVIPVYINDTLIDYPTYIESPTPELAVVPNELNFGVVDIGSSSVVKPIVLKNTGSTRSKFAVDLGSQNLEVAVTPSKGIVMAHSEITLNVELIGVLEGDFVREFWIKNSWNPLRVVLSATVIIPHLVVHHPNTTGDFTLIDFQPTYISTCRSETMVVQNISRNFTMFAILAEVNNELLTLSEAQKLHPEFNAFTIYPLEGKMEPFEGCIFTIGFCPTKSSKPNTGWIHEQTSLENKDFLVFVKIIRVHCLAASEIRKRYLLRLNDTKGLDALNASEEMPNDEEKNMAPQEEGEYTMPEVRKQVHAGVRICLHGEAALPSVSLLPTFIDLGCAKVGCLEKRVLRITNNRINLPIFVKYEKQAGIGLEPPKVWLKPQTAVEVFLNVNPLSIGFRTTKVVLLLFAHSHPVCKDKKLVCVGQVSCEVKVKGTYSDSEVDPKPGGSPEALIRTASPDYESSDNKNEQRKHNPSKEQVIADQRGNVSPLYKTLLPKVSIRKNHKECKLQLCYKSESKQKLPQPVNLSEITGNLDNINFVKALYIQKLADQSSVCKTTGFETDVKWASISKICLKKNINLDLPKPKKEPEPLSIFIDDPITEEPSPSIIAITRTYLEERRSIVYEGIGSPRRSYRIEELSIPLNKPKDRKTKKKVIQPIKKDSSDDLCASVSNTGVIPLKKATLRNCKLTEIISSCQEQCDKKKKSSQEKSFELCPTNCKYTYTPEEFAHKKEHDDSYVMFYRYTSKIIKLTNELKQRAHGLQVGEYETACKNLLNLAGIKCFTVSKAPHIERYGEAKYSKEFTIIPLSPIQLINVRVKPLSINFGKVAPFSECLEVLHIENVNNIPVSLRVLPGRSGVKLPYGDFKIVEPMSKTFLKLIYCAGNFGRYNGYLDYIVNDNHTFEITIMAEIVPKTLNLSESQIIFGPSLLEEAFQPQSRCIEIQNPLQAPSAFVWELPAVCTFTFTPNSGEIPPNCQIMCEVKYVPTPNLSLTTGVYLRAESGTKSSLFCKKVMRKPKVGFVHQRLITKDIPLNMEYTETILLQNRGYEDVTFVIDEPEPIRGCRICPQDGVIRARELKELLLVFQFPVLIEFDIPIKATIGNGLHISLKVSGKVVYPSVTIKPDSLPMKRINADSFNTECFVINNEGTVPAKINFPLENYTEFHISYSPKSRDAPLNDESILLNPGESKVIHLHFIPIDIASYVFYLPIVINDILGPALVNIPESIKPSYFLEESKRIYSACLNVNIIDKIPSKLPVVYMDFTVSGHCLTFSKLEFLFTWFIGDSKRCLLEDTLTISNVSTQPITFGIRSKELMQGQPFTMNQISGATLEDKPNNILLGTLPPKEDIVMKIEFQPLVPYDFDLELPIYMKGYNDGKIFNSIYIRGVYPPPTLKSMTTEIHFPPVPLNVESETLTFISALHYSQDTAISASIHPVFDETGFNKTSTLVVNFMEGNLITGGQGTVNMPVKVFFRSTTPVGFATTITFQDANGISCFIDVTAISDNSSITAHAFMKKYSENFDVIGDEVSKITTNDFKSRTGSNKPVSESSIPSQIWIGNSEIPAPRLQVASIMSSRPILYSSNNLLDNLEVDEDSITPIRYTLVEEPAISYPNFPRDTDSSEYALHMRSTIRIVEQWLFEQGLRCTSLAPIPDGLNVIKKTVPICEILTNLGGYDCLKFILISKVLPEDPQNLVAELYVVYSRLLVFLEKQGAFLAHLKPEYLFSYENYEIYIKKIKGLSPRPFPLPPEELNDVHPSVNSALKAKHESEVKRWVHHESTHRQIPDCPVCLKLLPESSYKLLNKQAWLDVILQIIKCLGLTKIILSIPQQEVYNSVGETAEESSYNSASDTSVVSVSLKDPVTPAVSIALLNLDPLASNIYSVSERILLSWLNAHCASHLGLLWSDCSSEKCEAPKPKQILNFDNDLRDCLALAACTIAYCPYLKAIYFKTLYLQPTSKEQMCHNACCLIEAWNAVHISFTVYVSDLQEPNVIFMVLLVAHLFETLPMLSPQTVIQFSATLNKQCVRHLQLINPTAKKLSFIPCFVGVQKGFYSIDKFNNSIIHIPPKEKTVLIIRFMAKKITVTSAVLILCGAGVSPNFARSLAFELEGYPASLQVHSITNIEVPMYQLLKRNVTIKSPFKTEADFDIWITETEPGQFSTFTAKPWSELLEMKLPRRITLASPTLSFKDGSGKGKLSTKIACLNASPQDYWLCFKHPQVGDFINKVRIIPKKIKLGLLELYVDANLKNLQCTCKEENSITETFLFNCPHWTRIEIPCRNNQLWDTFNTMFTQTLDESEKDFWVKHLETNIGLRLIQWLINYQDEQAAGEFQHLFHTEVTYKVSCNNQFVSPYKKIVIPDVRLDSHVLLPIHVSPSGIYPIKTSLTLVSSSNTEVRCYELKIYEHLIEETLSKCHLLEEDSKGLHEENSELWWNKEVSFSSSSEDELIKNAPDRPPCI